MPVTSAPQPAEAFSAFDQLLGDIEQDPITAAQLAEGRQWLGAQLHAVHPNLASLRLAAGLSQRQLAQACGLAQPHVSRYESGKHEPSLSAAMTLAAALGVDLNTFARAWTHTRQALNTLNAAATNA